MGWVCPKAFGQEKTTKNMAIRALHPSKKIKTQTQ
jgi:hypothetical protein